jgi:hypothetical protein
MAKLTIMQSKAVTELAKALYDFLPGSPHPYSDPAISFFGVAKSLQLEEFWHGGSKTPAIARLLQETYEQQCDKFCSLIEEIVKTSFVYKDGAAITRQKIDEINDLVKQVGFKVPSLWDPNFLRNLPGAKPEPLDLAKEIAKLKTHYLALSLMSDERKRGYAFEDFLNNLFTVHALNPRAPFKLHGEQIDGSLDFDSAVYLLEARWRAKQADIGDLLTFHGKVDGKATWSRGIFISYSGFTDPGLQQFGQGRKTNLICFCGQDLHFILQNQIGLRDVLKEKTRLAAEEGRSYVPVLELTYRNSI